jgi:hypothetical protein
MERFNDPITNEVTGVPLSGIKFYVQNYPSATAAVVYGVNDNTSTPLVQPLTTQANGTYPFYAADGHYQIISYPPGGQPIIADFILLDGTLTGLNGLTNIAALKALAVPTSSSIYIVKGYKTEGDGGQGIFFWNPADVTADNGGTVLACTANSVAAGRFNKLF